MLTIKKHWFLSLLLILGLLFSLQVFQSTPLEDLFFQVQAIYLIYIIGFLTTYLLNRSFYDWKFNKSILYLGILIFILPLYSAMRAQSEFGQPFLYGWLAQRNWFLLGFGIWIYHTIVNQKIPMRSVENIFVGFTLFSLITFTFISQFFPESALDSLGYLAMESADRGMRFRFQYYFINFGFIYYFISYMQTKQVKNLAFFLFFIIFIIFIIQGRTHMLNVAATLLIYIYFNTNVAGKVKLFYQAIIIGFFFFFIVESIAPDYFEKISLLFNNMFIVLNGAISSDDSANARVYEIAQILSYWLKNPATLYWGVGKLSSQFNNGFESIFGYFYPSDVGLLGGIFLYGIIGSIFIYLTPIFASIKLLKKLRRDKNIFIVSLKYLLIFSLITPQQGSLFFQPIVLCVPFMILLAYSNIQQRFINGK